MNYTSGLRAPETYSDTLAMHIIYLHQYFNTPRMSGGTRSYEMARRLVKMGHRVTMITSWREQDSRKDWFVTNEDGIEVHWLPVPYSNRMPYRARIKAFIRFALGAAQRAGSIRGDLVLATSTPLTISIPGALTSRKLKIPMVFEVRDLWPEVPIALGALRSPAVKLAARLLERWAYKHAEAVIALSPGMRDGVVRTGYDASRVALIPNSSDNEDFDVCDARRAAWRMKRAWLGSRPLLTYPGTFGRVNGVDYLIPLARVLKEISPEVRILLIGDGSEKASIREKADEAGVLDTNLFIEDAAPKAEMPDVFAGSDMICSLVINIPALFANSANKVFDAFAAGKPVLINHSGWQAEIIDSTGCGIVTAELPPEQAARLIAARINDGEWLSRAGSASKRLAEQHFDRDLLAAKLNDVLQAARSRHGIRASSIAPDILTTNRRESINDA